MPPLVNLASHPQPPWFLNLISPSVSLLNWHPLFQTPLMCSALNISCTVTFFLPQSLFSCLSGHQVLLPCHSLPGSLQCLLCAATQHRYFPGSVPLNGSSQLLSHDQPNLKSYWYYLLINLNEINSENSKTARLCMGKSQHRLFPKHSANPWGIAVCPTNRQDFLETE